MHLVGTEPQYNQYRVWVAYAVLVLLNIVDVVYTNYILTLSAEEANPIMNHIYQHFGIWGIISVKAFFLLLLGYTIPYISRVSAYCQYLFYTCVVVYGLLAAYHGIWFLGYPNLP